MQNNKYSRTRRACYTGYIVQAIVCNLAPILFVTFQDSFGISYSLISALVIVNTLTQMFVDLLSMKFVDRFGYRKSVLFAHAFAAGGLIMMGTAPVLFPMPYLWLVVSTVIYAAGSGLIEVMINPIIGCLPHDNSSAQLSMLHSFYCWGQVGTVAVSTVLLRLLSAGNWPFIPIIWSIIPIINFFAFTKAPIIEPTVTEDKMSISDLMRNRVFVLLLVVMACAGASEMAMSQWASLFAERSLMVDKVVGDMLGPCMFGVLMGTGRLLYGMFGSRIGVRRILMCASVMGTVSYAVAALSPWPLVSLGGCALCGLSVSVMWPGTVSIAADDFAGGGTAMYGLMAMFGDIGCSIGPLIVGVVSDLSIGRLFGLSDLQAGLLCGMIFPVIMFVFLLISHYKEKRQIRDII